MGMFIEAIGVEQGVFDEWSVDDILSSIISTLETQDIPGVVPKWHKSLDPRGR